MDIGGILLESHWWWLVLALLLGIAEIVIPGVFLIWLGAAAALTGVLALALGLPVPAQFVIFALTAIGAVYAGRRYLAGHPGESSDPLLNDRTARLIGQTVEVVAAIDGGQGRVRVGDSVWNARGPDNMVGARVRIVGADGTTLIVE